LTKNFVSQKKKEKLIRDSKVENERNSKAINKVSCDK